MRLKTLRGGSDVMPFSAPNKQMYIAIPKIYSHIMMKQFLLITKLMIIVIVFFYEI